MVHSCTFLRSSYEFNPKRQYQSVFLLLALVIMITPSAIFSKMWTHETSRLLLGSHSDYATGNTITSVCPAPPKVPKLVDLPEYAPESLRRYVTWHKVARKCLTSKTCRSKPDLLVLRCTPGVQCGGLGDRFRAIELIFLLAILSKRLFLIDWPAGPHSLVPLETVFHPRSIDWRKPLEVKYSSSFEVLNWSFKYNATRLPLNGEKGLYFDLMSQDFGKVMKAHKNIAVSSNAPHVFIFELLKNEQLLKNCPDLGPNRIATPILLRSLIQTLFSPTDLVKSLAVRAAFSEGAEYISVHARIGEDTQEADRPRFNKLVTNMDSVASGMLSCARACKNENLMHVYLASDSTRFKSVFARKANASGIAVKSLDGKILHVGKHFKEALTWTREEQCESFIRVFADLYLLSRGSYIVTTGSGFSKAAFHLGHARNVMLGYSATLGPICNIEKMGW